MSEEFSIKGHKLRKDRKRLVAKTRCACGRVHGVRCDGRKFKCQCGGRLWIQSIGEDCLPWFDWTHAPLPRWAQPPDVVGWIEG